MSKIIGRLYSVGIAKESTRGTANTTPTYWLPFNDLTLDEKQEKAFDGQAYALIEDTVAALTTKQWIEGSISGNIHDTTFGLLLYSAFGTLSTHAVHGFESTVYDNKFAVAETTQHQSLTYAVHDPGASQDYTYANGVITKMEIALSLKQFLTYTASFTALTGATISAFTPATTSENRFVPQYAALNIAGNYGGSRGAFYGTGTASSTVHVTAVSGFNCNNLTIGATVVGTNVPGGTTVAAIVSATAFDLSQATTGAGADFVIGFQLATCTASSTVNVTALSINTNLLRVGQTVYGKFVPVGATITAIVSASAFTLSAATTGAANNISFGPATIKVKSAKVTINKNVEAQEVLGSTSPADFLNKEFSVDLQVECIWQNETDWKTPFMANTQQSMNLDIKNTDVTIGTAANPELILTFPKVYITEVGVPKKVKDLIYQTVKIRAAYDTVNSAMILATLTNTANGY